MIVAVFAACTAMQFEFIDTLQTAGINTCQTNNDDIMLDFWRRQTTLLTQMAVVVSAAAAFMKAKPRYRIGPEHYSF